MPMCPTPIRVPLTSFLTSVGYVRKDEGDTVALHAHQPRICRDFRKSDCILDLVFWNCNGLRSVLKGALERLLRVHRPGIVCLGELKLRKDKLRGLEQQLQIMLRKYGYTSWLFNTCDLANTGYSGTAIITRETPLDLQEGWLHPGASTESEGRVISATFRDFILVHVYVPCSGLRQDKIKSQSRKRRSFDDHLKRHILCLQRSHTLPVILAGDLNVAPRPVDVYDAEALEDWPGCRAWETSLDDGVR